MVRYSLIIWLFFGFSGLLHAQSVGIGVEDANNNAVLELVSPNNDQGFLVPRLTTAQRTSAAFISKLSATDNGLLVYDSNENTFYFWHLNQWLPLQFGSDADSDPTNEIQDLTLDGNTLGLSNSEFSIDLSPFQGTNTDQQRIDALNLNGTLLEISLQNDNEAIRTLDLANLNTDNQSLILNGNILTIENGSGSIDLSTFTDDNDSDPFNEFQELNFVDGIISLSNDPSENTIDLSNYDNDYRDDFSGSYSDLTNIPADLIDGDQIGLTSISTNLTLTGNGTANSPLDLADNAVTGLKIADGSISNVDISGLAWTKISGVPTALADGDDVNDADADPANEIQDLLFSNGIISLRGDPTATSINLSGYDINAADDFSGSFNDLTNIPAGLLDGDDINDADANPANEIQDLLFSNGIISLTGDPTATSINLSGYDNNAADDFSGSFNDLTNIPAGLLDGDDINDADANPANEIQDLLFSNGIISLTGDPTATSINLSGYDNNAADDFSGSFNDLTDVPADLLDGDQTGLTSLTTNSTLTGDGTSLSPLGLADNVVTSAKILDGTIQNVDIAEVNWTKVTNVPTDLADGDNVNDADADSFNEFQTISRSGNMVSLSNDGGTFSIDDADASTTNEIQTLSRFGSTISLTSGGSVSVNDADFSTANEIQTLSQSGNTIMLSRGGGSVTVSGGTSEAFKASTAKPIPLAFGTNVITFENVVYDLAGLYDGVSMYEVKEDGYYNFQGLITMDPQSKGTWPWSIQLRNTANRGVIYEKTIMPGAPSADFSVDLFLLGGSGIEVLILNEGDNMNTTPSPTVANFFFSGRRFN